MAGPASALQPDSVTDALAPQGVPAVQAPAAAQPVQVAQAAPVAVDPAVAPVAAAPAQAKAAPAQSPTAYPGTPLQSPPEALSQPLAKEEESSYKEMLNKGYSEYEARYHATNPPGRVFPEGTPDPWRAPTEEKAVRTEVKSKPATGIISLTPEKIQAILSDPTVQARLKAIMAPSGGVGYDPDVTKAAQRAVGQ